MGLEYNVVYSFTTNPTYVTEEKIFVVEQAGSLPNLSVSHLPTTYCLILLGKPVVNAAFLYESDVSHMTFSTF